MRTEAPVCLCFEEMLGFYRLAVQPLPLGLLRPERTGKDKNEAHLCS